MDTFYVLAPTNSDVLHFGKGHDDNPPGRGSGRYAFGTGKRPNQHEPKAKKGFFNFGKKSKKEKVKVEIEKPKKDKETILRSGNAHDVLSIQSELTNVELRDAINRMQNIDDLRKYDARQRKSNWDKVDNMMKRAGDVVNWTSTGIRAWNNFAAIYNAAISNDSTKTKLPGISLPNQGGKEKDKGKG